MIADTSRAAYANVPLQQREREVMTACWRHFPQARFTRKELAAAMGWEINRITGRVLTLIERGFLTEHDETRDGGHLLSIADPSTTPRRMADERSNPESRMQPAGQPNAAQPQESGNDLERKRERNEGRGEGQGGREGDRISPAPQRHAGDQPADRRAEGAESVSERQRVRHGGQPVDRVVRVTQAAGPAAIPVYDSKGKLLCMADPRPGPGWPPDQDELHRKLRERQRRAA